MSPLDGPPMGARPPEVQRGDLFWIAPDDSRGPAASYSHPPRGGAGRRVQRLAYHDRGRMRPDVEPAPRRRAGQRPAGGRRGEPSRAERGGRVANLVGRQEPPGRTDRVTVRRTGGPDSGGPAIWPFDSFKLDGATWAMRFHGPADRSPHSLLALFSPSYSSAVSVTMNTTRACSNSFRGRARTSPDPDRFLGILIKRAAVHARSAGERLWGRGHLRSGSGPRRGCRRASWVTCHGQ